MCLISYNTRGFSKHKGDVCNFLLSPEFNGDKLTILCNQEHFVLKANSYRIRKALPGYFSIIKPAVKTTHDKGRPKGGLFIAVPDCIKNDIKDVSPAFWRTQAVNVTIGASRILIINSYFPTDPGTVVLDESELLETFQSIRHVIEVNDFDKIYWLGDINTDFVRKTGHVKCVENFVNEYQFTKAWDNFYVDFTHYQDTGDITHTSTVDHILWNDATSETIVDAGVIHIPENTSDHCPVYCVVNISERPANETPNVKPAPPKPSWKRATQDQKDHFKDSLENLLTQVEVPVSLANCKDVHCTNPTHCEEADSFIIQILQCVERSAYSNLPVPAPPKPKNSRSNKPGWHSLVQPYRDTAHFWHQVWNSAGRPLNTQLHTIMKRTRNIFHYQVRKLKKTSDTISRNKLLDACINGESDLFTEIKISETLNPVLPILWMGSRLELPITLKTFTVVYTTLLMIMRI